MEWTVASVRALREAYFNNETIRALAELYGCSEREVGRIIHGEIWEWAGGPIHGARVGTRRRRIRRTPIGQAARMGLSWEEAKEMEAAS